MHSRSLRRDRELRLEQGLLRLAAAVDDVNLVRKSRTLVDVFDLVRGFTEALAEKCETARRNHEQSVRRTAFKAFKAFVKMQERKRRNEDVVSGVLVERKQRILGRSLRRMRHVLHLERLWLADVRYQFAFGIREQAF